jgi:hypothetical protein
MFLLLRTEEHTVSKDAKASLVTEPGGIATGSSATTSPGKRSPDELPDGSGNDSSKVFTPDDEGRFDAG